MPPINASVTNQQITASVGETQIDVNVSGGVGPTGTAGAAATVSVGTVTTGAPGSSAAVVNVGSSSAAVLNFTIPAGATGATGAKGDKGDRGDTGSSGVVAATSPLTYDAATKTVGIALPLSKSDISGLGTAAAANTTDFAAASHTHGNITNDGKITLPILQVGNVLPVGATEDGTLVIGNISGDNVVASNLGGSVFFFEDLTVNEALAGFDLFLAERPTKTDYATASVGGVVKIGSGVTITDGVISVSTAYAATSHTHGNITSDGKIGTASGQIVVTGTGGVLTTAATISASSVSGLPTAGTGASNYCAGNDARLSDARTPLSHTHSVGQIDGFSAAAAAAAPVQSVTTAKLANAAVTVAKVSATGSPDATTFLRGDGS
ncbi:MAG: hypothetical protein EBR82_61415, partial [Caulobacteraceae bacterium]|nr:hypothetical protein [Caulobacteraceae bacterium]